MKFFKQTEDGVCDVIAIETVFSFLHEPCCFEEIKKGLCRHSFGTCLPEIGIYLEGRGVKTRLVSNCENGYEGVGSGFGEKLEQYKCVGIFEERVVVEDDIGDMPVIVNVDAFKVRGEKGGCSAHYVVLLKEDGVLYMYDGLNFDDRVKVDFEEFYRYSLDVNDFLNKGMWLFVEMENRDL
jgi:hypothetical protein